jgi:hypothetical protein
MMQKGDTVAIFKDRYTGKHLEGYARFIRVLSMDEGLTATLYCEVRFREEDRVLKRWIFVDKNGDPLYKP